MPQSTHISAIINYDNKEIVLLVNKFMNVYS